MEDCLKKKKRNKFLKILERRSKEARKNPRMLIEQ